MAGAEAETNDPKDAIGWIQDCGAEDSKPWLSGYCAESLQPVNLDPHGSDNSPS